MSMDLGKWSLLEKLHELPFVLKLLVFAATADLALVLFLDRNLLRLSLQDAVAQPGWLLLLIIGVGLLLSAGSALLTSIGVPVLAWLALTLQSWTGSLSSSRHVPDSLRYVSLLDAERELARTPDEERRKNVYAQVQEHEAERARWFAGVQTSAVCVALLIWAWITPGTTVAELGARYGWAPSLLLAVAGMPVAYQVWRGPPDRAHVLWPELAGRLYRERHPSWLDQRPQRPPRDLE